MRIGLIPTTLGSCSCHEHTTNLATGVSQQPVLDCGTITNVRNLSQPVGIAVPIAGGDSMRILLYTAKYYNRFFGLHFTRAMCRCILKYFYVIGLKSYRIRRNVIRQNNAKYTAITPFKVIQGHRFWYQSKMDATSD